MLKGIVGSMLLLFSFASCAGSDCNTDLNKDTCDILKTFTLADPKKELRFNHVCSELDNSNNAYKPAYALFEKGGQQKALILAEVSVGWLAYKSKPVEAGKSPSAEESGIFLELEKMQAQSLNPWKGDAFSIALSAKNTRTQKVTTGVFSKTYSYSHSGSGYPADTKYRISKTGTLDWEKLIEPEDESKTEADFCADCTVPEGQRRKNEYKGSGIIELTRANLPHPEDPHVLSIVLQNERTKEKIILQGPVLKNLKSHLNIKYSGPQRLSLLDVLNPVQEGGLWDVIGDAFKYGDCIYLRKQGKKEFKARWSKL